MIQNPMIVKSGGVETIDVSVQNSSNYTIYVQTAIDETQIRGKLNATKTVSLYANCFLILFADVSNTYDIPDGCTEIGKGNDSVGDLIVVFQITKSCSITVK